MDETKPEAPQGPRYATLLEQMAAWLQDRMRQHQPPPQGE